MGLIRKGLMLAIVFAVLPSPPDKDGQNNAQAQLSEFAYIGAATGAVSDMASFCTRQPTTCVVAGYITHTIAVKAKYNASLAYEWYNKDKPTEAKVTQPKLQPAKTSQQSALKAFDMIETGSTTLLHLASSREITSQTTLTVEDLQPEWLGPEPL